MRARRPWGGIAPLLLTACGDPPPPAPRADAAPDAPLDVASPDVAPDATPAEASVDIDVAPDVADVVTPDAPPDAVVADAPPDAAEDAPAEAAVKDAAVDARPDVAADDRLDAVADVVADARPDVLDAAADVRVDAPDAAPDVAGPDAPPGSWRSALFPDDWVPVHAGGRPDAMGRFLHDFSFAGYRRGDARPPYGRGAVVRTVDARLGDGRADARASIQADIDAACAAPGGGLRVVLLPAGTYRLVFPAAAGEAALRVTCSNLVLRGAGPSMTRLLLDDPTHARQRAMIRFAATSYSPWAGAATTALTRDAPRPTRTVAVADAARFAPGDFVAVRTDITEAFRAEHGMNLTLAGTVVWAASTAQGLLYPRRVTAVDVAAGTVTLDAPTRYPLQRRDNARLYRPSGYLEEVGVEDLAVGMREHPTSAVGTAPGPLGDVNTGYDVPGTAAYAVHSSSALRFDAVHDGWLRNVETFAPAGNASGAHVLSIALWLTAGTSRVTVDGCRFARPQYRGGGGNGYLFLVEGDDNLVVDSTATYGRHNFITAHVASSGNVFLRARSVDSRYSDDSHRLLSQSNLYDNVTLDRAWLQAVNRGDDSNGAGFTATQTVFWNARSVAAHALTRRAADGFPEGFAVETAQYGWGYVVGTSGPASAVVTRAITNSSYAMQNQGAPADFVEGVGRGATLFPASLYEEQLRRRALRGE